MTMMIDGILLKELLNAGKRWLEVNYPTVDQLNVFPVPDGDTGKNMVLTLRNAYKAIAENSSANAAQIARLFSQGAVMGSRGNSGTILSQILVGFAEALHDRSSFELHEMANAFSQAAHKAYQGVQNPVEGTILTVIKSVADHAQTIDTKQLNLEGFLSELVTVSKQAVERTPEQLPILKEAGVVDSGGTGLMYVLEGMLKAVRGEDIPEQTIEIDETEQPSFADLQALANEQYNYDVQFIIQGSGLSVERIKADIEQMGDSGVIVGDDTLVKVHIHVDDPSQPIGYGVQLGTLDDVVIENMQLQYQRLLAAQQAYQKAQGLTLREVDAGQIAVIAVAAGHGMAQILGDSGAAAIIEGGQTNNPSVDDILRAAASTGTDKIIVLPNNKNIILAAQQAARYTTEFEIEVVDSVSFPQGASAMLGYNANGDLATIADDMRDFMTDVTTIEITNAIRNVELGGAAVKDGQWLALVDGKISAAEDNLMSILATVFATLSTDDYEVLDIYTGEDASAQDAAEVMAWCAQQFDHLDVRLLAGSQPHYPYIIGLI